MLEQISTVNSGKSPLVYEMKLVDSETVLRELGSSWLDMNGSKLL